MVGVEPTREVIPKVFETFAYTDFATSPIKQMPVKTTTHSIFTVKRRQLAPGTRMGVLTGSPEGLKTFIASAARPGPSPRWA